MNGLKTAKELAVNHTHGTRIKHLGGCRCVPCRAANSRYASARFYTIRRGEGNGIVSAEPSRNHIAELLKHNIGLRTIQKFSKVGRSILQKIRNGEKQNIRAKTERGILAVTPDILNYLPKRTNQYTKQD